MRCVIPMVLSFAESPAVKQVAHIFMAVFWASLTDAILWVSDLEIVPYRCSSLFAFPAIRLHLCDFVSL